MRLLLPIIKFKIKFSLKANVLSAASAREENARANSDGIARFVWNRIKIFHVLSTWETAMSEFKVNTYSSIIYD